MIRTIGVKKIHSWQYTCKKRKRKKRKFSWKRIKQNQIGYLRKRRKKFLRKSKRKVLLKKMVKYMIKNKKHKKM